jgi:predicted DNA-binding transcriptional regulator AlpA
MPRKEPAGSAIPASAGDLSRELKVPRRTIYNWVDRDDFPAPVGRAGGSRLWDVDEVKRWRRDTEDVRKPGRPPA